MAYISSRLRATNLASWTNFHQIFSSTTLSKTLKPYNVIQQSYPLFKYQYFEDDRDAKALAYGIQVAINITRQKPFVDMGVELYAVKLPGCESLQFDTFEYWECHVRVLTLNFYHYVGTCKMGPRTDASAVVIARLRVHGMQTIRVVDIGIIPEAPTSHTAAVAYMIGEKGADMIKQDNGLG